MAANGDRRTGDAIEDDEEKHNYDHCKYTLAHNQLNLLFVYKVQKWKHIENFIVMDFTGLIWEREREKLAAETFLLS